MSVPWTMRYRIETERLALRPYDEADAAALNVVRPRPGWRALRRDRPCNVDERGLTMEWPVS